MLKRRRNYVTLSKRQQRRRIIEHCALNDTQPRSANETSVVPFTDSHYENEEVDTLPQVFDRPLDSDSETTSTDSSSNQNESMTVENKIEIALLNWDAACPNLPQLSKTKLLQCLNSFFPGIPKCSSTLFNNSPINSDISEMHHGRYLHFNDCFQSISKFLNRISFKGDEISFNLNVDGVPLFGDSRKFHAYPILMQTVSHPSKIFCVGVYMSETAMKNTAPPDSIFLRRFVDDMASVLARGMLIDGHLIKVRLNAIICDAPMRAELKRIVNHNAYYSCERCVQKGERAGGHVALTAVNSDCRTNQSFYQMLQPQHHRGIESPILNELGVRFVSQFPLDYMHLVCLGVTKRLLLRWKSSRKASTRRHLSPTSLSKLNEVIAACSHHIPKEFSRRLRGGLDSVKHWKATEFRLFVAYIGIFTLKDILPTELYRHYLLLSLGVRLLLSENQEDNMETTKEMIIKFVSDARYLYGDDFISYNVHSLIHLPDDYQNFGRLDKVSCFKFESYLGSCVKYRLSGRNKPLEQLRRHLQRENERMPTAKRFQSSNGKFTAKSFTFCAGIISNRDSESNS